MSRDQIESAASDWVARRDAGLTRAEEGQFRAWLAEPRHARAFARHEKTFRIFARPAQVSDGAAIAAEIRLRIAKKRRRRLRAALGTVAVLAIIGLVWQRPAPPPVSLPPSSSAVVIRPLQRTLPDGSVVELKAGAEIASNFTAAGTGSRRVKLFQGEAHFQVAHNKERPFIVEVDNVEVRAVGTAFSVARESARVEVVVGEGTVAVEQHQADSQPLATVATLTAGESTTVEFAAAAPPQVEPLAPDALADRMAWRTPRLEFTGTPLPEAIRLMNEFNPVKFVIADPALDSLEVSGYFRASQPEAFLLLLEKGLGVQGERRGATIVLHKAP